MISQHTKKTLEELKKKYKVFFNSEMGVGFYRVFYEKESMKPMRIQRKRIKGWRMPENTVYVGRPTKWSNPFKIGMSHPYLGWIWKDGRKALSREMAIDMYTDMIKNEIKTNQEFREFLERIKGKNLACWCPLNQPCHADVLLKIANG